MANRNTSGFGLIAAGTVGSTPATQGQGKYYIIAGAGAGGDLFQGCSVRMKDGYITEAQSTRTFLTIGVFNGTFLNKSFRVHRKLLINSHFSRHYKTIYNSSCKTI